MADVNSKNMTFVMHFVFTGFAGPPQLKGFLFLLFLMIYITTLLGNTLLIALVTSNPGLHRPMYFFLINFSFMEIWYTTTTVPIILVTILADTNISITGCLLQFYFFTSVGCAETFLLTAMSYDRYLAICHPLHYSMWMNNKTCMVLAACCWIFGFLYYATPVIVVSRLSFCGPDMIKHLFCDLAITKYSCDLDYFTEVTGYVFSVVILMSTFLVISVSYFCILITIVRMPSVKGRRKAFSTCTSHLTVVIIFFASVTFMYLRPATWDSIAFEKVLCLVYSMMVPFVNPLIYSLRNKEVKKLMMTLFYGKGGMPEAP